MRKRIFSPRLYLDGLKQLRLIGIAGLVILALEAVLIPVGKVLSQMDRQYVSVELVGFMSMHPILVLCFCVLAPLMTLYLFQFLNKRNASDFYHAIPETRLCLFFSFTAAILTWVVGAAVLTTLLSVGIHMAFPTFFTVNFTSVFAALANILAGCVLVTACVSLAMCVTGTVFTNVMVSLMIIFLPRLLILLLNTSVTSNLPLIASNHFVFWLDPSCNVPVGTVLGALGIGQFQNAISSWMSGLYTLALGLVYLAAAAFLFHRRKSEAAGHAAPNRILQAVFRLSLAMVPCAIACYGIFYNIVWKERDLDIFMFVVIYIIALVVYFLYEIITTRKWKNLLKSIPALGVLVVLNVALTGGMLGLYQSSLAFSPDAEDIQSVRIMSQFQYTDYFTARTQQIEIDSPEVKEVVARQLRFSADLCRQSLRQYYDRAGQNLTTACVAIRTGASTHYRNILLSTEDYKTLSSPLSGIPAFREIYQNLPRLGSDSTTVYMSQSNLSYAAVQSIYKRVCDEVAAMPFEQWYTQIAGQNQNGIYYDKYAQFYGSPEIRQYGYLDMLTVSTTIGTQRYDFSLPLYTNLTESCNLYLDKMKDLQKTDAEAILKKLQEGNWRSDDRMTVEAFNLEGNPGQSQSISIPGGTMLDRSDAARDFAAMLERTQPLDVTKPLYRVTMEVSENVNNGRNGYYPSYVTYTAFFQAAGDRLPALFIDPQGDQKKEEYTESGQVYTQVVSTALNSGRG